MDIAVILAIVLTLGIFIISIKRLKKFKFDLRSLGRIGIISALTIILYMIKIVPFPQGGGFSLLSILPIMILSSIYGIEEGLLTAIIVGALKGIFQPPFYPLQLPLDYFGSMMAIAFTPIFGSKSKVKLILGGTFAGLVSIVFSVLSGGIFFGQFAPKGMNIWRYSIGYNFLGYGIEVLLSIIVLSIFPLEVVKQTIKR